MYELRDITYNQIAMIEELWEKNRQYHENISEHFDYQYRTASFKERMKGFSSYDPDDIKITVAENDEECIGYCISTIDNGKGELQSLHVRQFIRGQGVGKRLVTAHLEWMKGKKCGSIGVTVSHENSSTIDFYRSMGFFPNTLYMQQKDI